MDFSLTDEQRLLRHVAHEYCEKKVQPLVREAEHTQQFPRGLFPEMAGLGFLGIAAPAEFGGAGTGKLEECLFIEELARVAGGIASAWMVQACVVPGVLSSFGSEEQKARYLAPMLRGETIGALAVTEPDAGNDVKGITTQARRDGEGFRLNGTKTFITLGTIADFALVLAYTDRTRGIDGMDLFIVDRATPGFTSAKLPKNAYRSSDTATLTFEDCYVPRERMVGGGGFRQVMKAFVGERILVAARSVGIARAALEASTRYAQERKQFGRPIGYYQAVAFRVAEMATAVEAARLFTHYAASLLDRQAECVTEVAMAKLFATEVAVEVTERAMRTFGGHGVIEDEFPVARYFMDARVSVVTVGSSDIQKRTIARRMGLECE
jgi:butyryl-CoA dehydrogenase